MLDAAELRAIFPFAANADELAPAISKAWDRFGIASKSARAGFLGITGNETGGYATIGREDMRYSAERAFELFPKARANPDDTRDRCASVPQDRGKRFASWIYADLYGNGPESSQDGWNYRGGGMIQLTFRSAYAACAAATGVNLVSSPDLIITPGPAALSAAWFISIYKPQILPLLDKPDDESFLDGAALVGWSDPAATQRRLEYRRRALALIDGDASRNPNAPTREDRLRAIQRALVAAGHDPGPVDGVYGPRTAAALKAFQADIAALGIAT